MGEKSDRLIDMVKHEVRADRLRLFVIDCSKALRFAIDGVYCMENSVQRCRNHAAAKKHAAGIIV